MSKHFAEIPLPCIMGILNVTPDSFSDAGQFFSETAAIEHMHAMVSEGAMIIDIGGESTNPSAKEISWEVEWARIKNVLKEAVKQNDICVSVDTYHLETAKLALENGANIINDVQATWHFKEIVNLVKQFDAHLMVTHNSRNCRDFFEIENSIMEIISEFRKILEIAKTLNFDEKRIILDPGIGFGKSQKQNLDIFKNISLLSQQFSSPVVCATSKKSFLQNAIKSNDQRSLLGATIATTVVALRSGCKIFRVHNVAENLSVIKLPYYE